MWSHDQEMRTHSVICVRLFFTVSLKLCRHRTISARSGLYVLHYQRFDPLSLCLRLCASSWIPQTTISFLLLSELVVGTGVFSKPRQDDLLLDLARKGLSVGGNRPRTAHAVPGLAERWWELTGQLPRQGALKWCLATFTGLWDSLLLPVISM